MFGYLLGAQPGGLDPLMRALARGFGAAGLRVAGAVQSNPAGAGGRRCDMALHLLPSGRLIRISENRGPLARGCRLDAGALEQAVAEVLAALAAQPAPPQVVVLNKFGKQEAEGRGFRPVIAEALERGIAVLVGVGPGNLAALEDFAGGMAQPLRLPNPKAAPALAPNHALAPALALVPAGDHLDGCGAAPSDPWADCDPDLDLGADPHLGRGPDPALDAVLAAALGWFRATQA